MAGYSKNSTNYRLGGIPINTIPVVAVVGPTASGKTTLAVEICKHFNGEVISADSMQIYKYMNIATAKPTDEEIETIPHHLIDFLEPTEHFSVAQYCTMAKACIEDIHKRGKLPVIVGGTGLYIDSLLNNVEFSECVADYDLREKLRAKAEQQGAKVLLDELRQIDPETAETLHPNNLGRIIRALELYYTTGITRSRHDELSRQSPSPYEACFIGLNYRDRQVLYNRINSRVDAMLELGLMSEAQDFINRYKKGTAQQAIGYKELEPYFSGSLPLTQAIENLKQETRRYAKRQLTWFRRNEAIHWIFADDYKNKSEITQKAVQIIIGSGVVGR